MATAETDHVLPTPVALVTDCEHCRRVRGAALRFAEAYAADGPDVLHNGKVWTPVLSEVGVILARLGVFCRCCRNSGQALTALGRYIVGILPPELLENRKDEMPF